MKMIKVVLMAFIMLVSVSAYAGAGQVDINKADVKTLSSQLNGVGERKAQAIIDYRNTNGAFKSIEELSRVKGISVRTIEKNRDRLIVSNSES